MRAKLRQNPLDVFRVNALLPVLLTLMVGPLGMGVSVVSTTLKARGESCPCEALPSVNQPATIALTDIEQGNPMRRLALPDNVPFDDDCPDNCPDCGCCRTPASGVATVFSVRLIEMAASIKYHSPPVPSASGILSGVFRPPRSRN